MGGNHHFESKLVVKFGVRQWQGTFMVPGFGKECAACEVYESL